MFQNVSYYTLDLRTLQARCRKSFQERCGYIEDVEFEEIIDTGESECRELVLAEKT